jgi:hypothetical protein
MAIKNANFLVPHCCEIHPMFTSNPYPTRTDRAPAALYFAETAEEFPQDLLCDVAVKSSLPKMGISNMDFTIEKNIWRGYSLKIALT